MGRARNEGAGKLPPMHSNPGVGMETGHEPASRVPAELAVDEQVHGAGVMALVLQHEILPPGRSGITTS